MQGKAPRQRLRQRLRRCWPWLRWGTVALLSTLLLLDILFPPPLPRQADTSTLVLAADGTPLRAFADADGVWRYPTRIDQVSPLYLQALLNYEDRWFWRHPGVNPIALARAAGQWLQHGRIVSGGSTLTMQVARLLDDQDSRSVSGKLRQMLRALQLEVHLSKAQILTLYLQRAPFGGTIEGVEAASWAYLGKPASRLSHAEAALLAVLPQAPSRLRPDRHPQAAQAARDKVLQRMADLQVWSRAEVDDAKVETVVARSLRTPLHAALLAQRLRQQQPRRSRIQTTLDSQLQRTLEERVATYFSQLPERTSAALLVVDNRTLQARAYVGSVAFADKARLGHVDMVRASRSPGSTLKPFLYGLAMDDGLIHSQSLLVDAPQSFSGYRPGNFDTAFHGPVAVADALRQSLNVPAVDVLDRLGPERFSARLANAGVRLRYPRGARPNLSLVLGGVGATLEDLVAAYAALNRNGIAGRVRYQPTEPLQQRRLLSPGASWIIRTILEEHPRPGYGGDTFDTSRRPPVAWKTGTSYGYRDAWAIGSTARYTVGVWVGRPDGTPLPGQYGAVTALPLMFEVVDSLPGTRANAGSAAPGSVSRQMICWPLGTAPDPATPGLCQRQHEAWILDGAVPPTFAERDAQRWQAGRIDYQVDAGSGRRVSATCTREHATVAASLARWPALAQPWLSRAELAASQLPALAADCSDDGREAVAKLQVIGIKDGSTLLAAPGNRDGLRLRVHAVGSQQRLQWLLDGRWIAQTTGSQPFVHDFNQPGRHTLTAMSQAGAWTRIGYQVIDSDRATR
ncbi:penicillin-binding protein 1C [Pseudoxanthomonas dokdonensis]|uniref:peptidoglycan glycosyltransferase n=1 Tax=Pseudoxanthomonas dokdonensis TaxID=344882 RepID=A0A0R0CKW5_9GAMM|nr:penicillin-binding protein 1C [Pseudoxanthomonas dokdonensis]KRG70669.1 penicillin-binding protein [Pseudoxanthomonas dokdonensis]